MIRAVILLAILAALGAGVAWLDSRPPPPGASTPARLAAERPPTPVGAPTGGHAALATPFGDALFRWRCTAGLRDALGERPDWPVERLAHLCLCAADRLREDGPHDITIGTGDVASALESAEARLCRRR